MSRLKTIDPARAEGRAKEIFEGPLKGKAFNIFKAMANSPAALETYLGMAGALSRASLTEKEREAIQLVIGEANACGYCVAAHTAIGMKAGLTKEQTMECRRGDVKSDARLGALVRFAARLHEKRGHVSDEDVSAMRAAGYADAHIAEAVACYALAVYTNVFNHVNQTEVDFPAASAV